MKWVKVAIGAVIAIAVVPMIALSVFNLTQETEVIKEVEFTINVSDSTYTPNVFESIILYSDVDVDNDSDVTNISVVKLNNVVTNDLTFRLTDNVFTITSISQSNGEDQFDDNGIYIREDGIFQDGDIVTLTFEVTQAPILSGITATLLLLAPVIFVSGVLYFIYNNKEEGI